MDKNKIKNSDLSIVAFVIFIFENLMFVGMILSSPNYMASFLERATSEARNFVFSALFIICLLTSLTMAIIDVRKTNRKKTLSKIIISMHVGVIISFILTALFSLMVFSFYKSGVILGSTAGLVFNILIYILLLMVFILSFVLIFKKIKD